MALFWDAAPAVPSPVLNLQAGQFYVPQAGWYWYKGSDYTSIQRYDPIAQVWRYGGDDTRAFRLLYFDGRTIRIANPTGTPTGAVVTTAGSSYTSVPTVTAGAGSSSWTAIVGGALSTAGVISAAGTGYQYPPLLWIQQPPQLGMQAHGYTTISNGTISAVTLDNQGAGYLAPPICAVINDFRDTVGSGGQVTLSLTGAQTVTGVEVLDHGIPITGGTVPALTLTGGGGTGAAATLIMEWTVTSYAVTNGGVGYAGQVEITTIGNGVPTTASAYVNPQMQTSFLRSKPAIIQGALSAGVLTATGQTLVDGGLLGNAPTPLVLGAAASTVATLTLGLAGANDFFWIQAG